MSIESKGFSIEKKVILNSMEHDSRGESRRVQIPFFFNYKDVQDTDTKDQEN